MYVRLIKYLTANSPYCFLLSIPANLMVKIHWLIQWQLLSPKITESKLGWVGGDLKDLLVLTPLSCARKLDQKGSESSTKNGEERPQQSWDHPDAFSQTRRHTNPRHYLIVWNRTGMAALIFLQDRCSGNMIQQFWVSLFWIKLSMFLLRSLEYKKISAVTINASACLLGFK